MTRKRTLPKTLKVGGIDYKIVVKDGIRDNKWDGANYGMLTRSKALIEIGKDMSSGRKEESLCHEIMHILHGSVRLSVEEGDVEAQGILLHQILVDNNLGFYRRR